MTTPPARHLLDPQNWVSAYADFLYRYAISRVNNEDQARDLVQETFLAGLQSQRNFAGKSSERTWLTAILKNKIYDVYRKKVNGLKTAEMNDQTGEEPDFFHEDGHWKQEHQPQAFGVDDFDPLANKELNRVLLLCLQKLPALWFSVFTMKHMEDEATEMICKELRLTQANFWVIIHRAKLNLRACLQRNWM
ncbi:sigma-70 family RNA polymerase sigma factor [Mucilaginibacter achroorhodeus]|uniref:Sigma-70 family RNA polymerase sigma factor n=1 Tax=Mucilaginibacter achroorhodeus TaxID=2599294 RepID=A0A563TXW2_9SPHI|nr:sigma-70 family RNA polymerase sigma factor [Mucilaginibacter achroorhodeus]TWR24185.1 sigma-70 family RNA polymerase sigma factor [Mucilaginibacter achroorhodeus]